MITDYTQRRGAEGAEYAEKNTWEFKVTARGSVILQIADPDHG